MKASRPYARLMKQVIGHIAKANSDYVHPFLESRADVKRVGYIMVISTDRGLCGGLNSNLFRKLLPEMPAGRRRASRSTGLHRPEGAGVLPPPEGQHGRLASPTWATSRSCRS
jgi:hypothetical protein